MPGCKSVRLCSLCHSKLFTRSKKHNTSHYTLCSQWHGVATHASDVRDPSVCQTLPCDSNKGNPARCHTTGSVIPVHVSAAPGVTALVFGREESGLTEAELRLCAHACAIPTGRMQASMNLSHAVAVVLCGLFERRLALLGFTENPGLDTRGEGGAGAGAACRTPAVSHAGVVWKQQPGAGHHNRPEMLAWLQLLRCLLVVQPASSAA